MRKILIYPILLAIYFLNAAHIGSPNIVFEGSAGEYPVLVSILPPEVVPGTAQVSVRVMDKEAREVFLQAVYYRYGDEKAPSADPTEKVPGDDELFTGQLWLMSHGSASVKIIVEGNKGTGSTVIPVPALASAQLEMESELEILLIILGAILFIGGATIVGASAGEGMLKPGEKLTSKKRVKSILIGCLAALLLGGTIYFGAGWWNSEENKYQRYMYQPVGINTEITAIDHKNKLTIHLDDKGHWDRKAGDLVPDHGKLMHLFLINQDEGKSFAHLHPLKVDSVTYDVVLPDLPAGNYHAFADIVHLSGLSETLVSEFEIQGEPQNAGIGLVTEMKENELPIDADDTWYEYSKPKGQVQILDNGIKVKWENSIDKKFKVDQIESLKFSFERENGMPVVLEPYLGMLGHSVVFKQDASVFIHLHPIGTISMAAQEAIAGKVGDEVSLCLTLDSTNYDVRSLGLLDQNQVTTMRDDILKLMNEKGLSNKVSFPYAFPKAGDYRIWVQVKIDGEILTAGFDVKVEEKEAG
ncbi:hypothetical protein [Flexithrix dorotheae]|uniref:hypothetical protein n=1 Tax=Flexithrix dorotheae TaxID=70993 RepID=UPI00035E216A|nr:hypothetical protein [Flexithrix dorotheae]